jgi:hypothetical protein
VPGANGSSVTVTQYDLGGPSVVLGGVVANAVSVVGGDGGADGLRLLTTDGDVYRLRSSNWQSTGLEANVLATVYPG